jgi:rifampicin phosphotransferase
MTKYTFLWCNTHPLFYLYGNIHSYSANRHIPFNDANDVIQVSHGNRMTCYVGTKDLERDSEAGARFLDPAFAQEYLTATRAQCDAHQRFFQRCTATDFSILSMTELLPYWKELTVQYGLSVGYFRGSQQEPSQHLVDELAKELSADELSIVLLPPEPDLMNREQADWKELTQAGFTPEGVQQHLRSYPWLLQNATTYEQALDELMHRARTSKDAEEMVGDRTSLCARQEAILSRFPELRGHVHTLQSLAFLRAELKACWAATEYYAIPLLEAAARQSGVDQETLTRLYRYEDICELLMGGRTLTLGETAARELCTIQICSAGVLTGEVGEAAERLARERLPEWYERTDTQELHGTAARPGKVVGIVHVLTINDPKATRAFRESFTDGILVTSMTQPNVVDIACHASAIITDEGGMLSHAAIISREFGIPCIVGTKRATTLLKDGDTVEVDADNGVVRILKS